MPPHGLQHTRHPCPSPTPGACSNSWPSNHVILCRPLLLPPSIFPSIRIFSNESTLINERGVKSPGPSSRRGFRNAQRRAETHKEWCSIWKFRVSGKTAQNKPGVLTHSLCPSPESLRALEGRDCPHCLPLFRILHQFSHPLRPRSSHCRNSKRQTETIRSVYCFKERTVFHQVGDEHPLNPYSTSDTLGLINRD